MGVFDYLIASAPSNSGSLYFWLALCVAGFLLIIGLVFFSVVRRRKRGKK